MVIKNLNNFLKLKKNKFTKNIKLKERLPRLVDKSEEKKLKKIKNLVSKNKYSKLLELETLFNDHKKNLKLLYLSNDTWYKSRYINKFV